jgi:hypothetical protein
MADTHEDINFRIERNALAPLNRLPDEILVYIFRAVQDRPRIDSIDGSTTSLPRASTHEWRHLMLVCSRFRDVALRSSVLWTYIDSRWPKH